MEERKPDVQKEKKITGEKKVSPDKSVGMVTIIFKQNRKFDLKIGREYYTFLGREAKKVPKSVITHPDFIQQEKYFVIK